MPTNTVRDILRPNIATLLPEATAKEAHQLMGDKNVRHIPIVNDAGGGKKKLVGILSQRDLVRAMPSVLARESYAEREAEVFRRPISDFMTPNPITVPAERAITVAAELLRSQPFDSLLVVDDGGMFLGILTHSDFLKLISGPWRTLCTQQAGEIMTTKILSLKPSEPIRRAIWLMQSNRIRHVPLIDDTKGLQGLVSMRDLLRCLPNGTKVPPNLGPMKKLLAMDERDPKMQKVLSTPLDKIMTKQVVTSSSGTLAPILADIMLRDSYGCVPIVSASKKDVVGIVSPRDLLGVVASLKIA